MGKKPDNQKNQETAQERALNIIRAVDRPVTTSSCVSWGITTPVLYGMVEDGLLERIERGLYRLTESPELSQPDLVVVALKYPRAVICLVSALSYHGLTTQIPHEIHIALPQHTKRPSLKHPPLAVHWFSPKTYEAGKEEVMVDKVKLAIYSPEKTIADCFKFRSQIGLDIAIEALREYRNKGKLNTQRLLQYAKVCRVTKIMRPYMESILA